MRNIRPNCYLDHMEGSVRSTYARSYLKADLRNTRMLLGLFDGAPADEARRLEELVHDVTVGLREQCPADVDVEAVRRFVADEAPAAARQRGVADDTLGQLARSLDRVLPWWRALPAVETLLDDARWPAPIDGLLAIEVGADERFRLLGLPRTRDALRARFEKYVSKHADAHALHLLDEHGEIVLALVSEAGAIRLAG
jgi:hypothetical protein